MSAESHSDRVLQALESPSSKQGMKEHIENLGQRTLESREAFERIAQELAWFDRKKFKNKHGEPLERLLPPWNKLRETYNALLTNSRKDATTIKGVCDRYITMVLKPLDKGEVLVDDIKKGLGKFIEDTKKYEGRAQCTAKEFDELRYELNMYRDDILEAVWGAEVASRVATLQDSIRKLSDQLASIGKAIADNVKGAGRKIVGIVTAMWPGSASKGGTAPQGDAPDPSSSVDGPKEAELQSDLAKQEAQLKSELANIDDVPEKNKPRVPQGRLAVLVENLQPSGSAFQGLLIHIGALANFWSAVRADCQLAHEHLERVDPESINSPESKQLLGRQLAGSAYEILSLALGTYVSQLAKV